HPIFRTLLGWLNIQHPKKQVIEGRRTTAAPRQHRSVVIDVEAGRVVCGNGTVPAYYEERTKGGTYEEPKESMHGRRGLLRVVGPDALGTVRRPSLVRCGVRPGELPGFYRHADVARLAESTRLFLSGCRGSRRQ